MARARSRTTRSSRATTAVHMKAEIGRFDGEIKTVAFTQGESVRQLAERAGFNIGMGESVNDSRGNEIALTSDVESGMTYYITGNYKQGC